MQLEQEGRIAGEFHGYRYGRVHEFCDGSRWRQEGRKEEYVYRERPAARILLDRGTGRTYLDVEGTSGVVEVVRDGPLPGGGMWGA